MRSRAQTVLAMLCVPARFVPTDLLEMLTPLHGVTKAIRLLRHCDDPTQFMAIMQMVDQPGADRAMTHLSGQRFNSFEDVTCTLAYVRTVHFDDSASSASSHGSCDTVPRTHSPVAGLGMAPRVLSIEALGQGSTDTMATGTGNGKPRVVEMASDEQTINAVVSARPTTPVMMSAFPTLRRETSCENEPNTCVVCLERMERDNPASLTTACNHSFHVK